MAAVLGPGGSGRAFLDASRTAPMVPSSLIDQTLPYGTASMPAGPPMSSTGYNPFVSSPHLNAMPLSVPMPPRSMPMMPPSVAMSGPPLMAPNPTTVYTRPVQTVNHVVAAPPTPPSAWRQEVVYQDPQASFLDFLEHHAKQDDVKDGIHTDFGMKEPPNLGIHKAATMATEAVQRLNFKDRDTGRPFNMTPTQHVEYQDQLAVMQKAEKEPHEKVELHHVEQMHRHVEQAKAGRLEKDLLHLKEDQLYRRLDMLERIAMAAPETPGESHHDLFVKELQNYEGGQGPEVSPFMEKFLPVPLGGGLNWHYFNHYEGFYIQRDKIAQREAQLKHMIDKHQHNMIFNFAGKKKEDIPDGYWVRDHRSWIQKVQAPKEVEMPTHVISQAAGTF